MADLRQRDPQAFTKSLAQFFDQFHELSKFVYNHKAKAQKDTDNFEEQREALQCIIQQRQEELRRLEIEIQQHQDKLQNLVNEHNASIEEEDQLIFNQFEKNLKRLTAPGEQHRESPEIAREQADSDGRRCLINNLLDQTEDEIIVNPSERVESDLQQLAQKALNKPPHSQPGGPGRKKRPRHREQQSSEGEWSNALPSKRSQHGRQADTFVVRQHSPTSEPDMSNMRPIEGATSPILTGGLRA